MRIIHEKNHVEIKSLLLDNPLWVGNATCLICLEEQIDGWCSCNYEQEFSKGELQEAQEWLDAGISQEEIACSGLLIQSLLRGDSDKIFGECAALSMAMANKALQTTPTRRQELS